MGRSKRDLVRIREANIPGACATSSPRGKRSLPEMDRWLPRQHTHFSQAEERSPGLVRSVYFTGRGDQLRLKPAVDVPRGHFTLEIWIKPEGGQRSPSVIAGLYDKCFYTSSDRGWLLGIQAISEQANKDPRFFFSLKTDRAHKVTTITSNTRYLPNQWSYLVATYDGQQMKLFVNGAQVAVSPEQSGEIFSPLTKKCKVLMVGGNALSHNYRGSVKSLSLWKKALSQREIQRYMHSRGQAPLDDVSQLVVQENFENVLQKWLTVKDGSIPLTEEPGHSHEGPLRGSLDTTLEPPPCGQTVCDNVEVVTNYNRFWSFRKPKTVRYRVVNVHDDERRKPTVTEHQINLQHQHLNDAFRPYNITWERTVLNVYNSSLRNRLVLANCDISKVGDEECDPECNHTLTGYDAGYCKRQTTPCPEHKQGNGVCDAECNWDNFNYDNGDCCNPNITDVTKTCFNPASPLRAYLDVKELKEALNLDGTVHLNIFFANSSDEDLAGVATWPWDKEALTHLGGIVLNPSFYGTFGHTHTMIHEIGHSLGLYHVFRGISEVESCNDGCMETEPSLETGDLCSDTNPTPKHKHCRDPEPSNDTCGRRHFVHTPFNNYMSYAGPPDVEQVCEPSVRTWSPNAGVDTSSVGSPPCPLQGCMLQLEFHYPLVPDSMIVWVTFFSPEETLLPAIHNILLLTASGQNISLGPQNVFCDTPLTLKLSVNEEVYGVQFFTVEQHLEIDATLLISKPECPFCKACQPVRYRLQRQPPFSHALYGVIVPESRRRYVDRDVVPGQTYTYQVITVSDRAESEPSPALTHQLGLPYCGDGNIQKHLGEECDDLNSVNRDGCSSQCKMEPFFNCVDEPSLCYFYDGDGVCEDFERETSVRDCGLYTPSGFLDQWATEVEVSHQENSHCPSTVVVGYPAVAKTCQSKAFDLFDGVSQYAWFPCQEAQHHSRNNQYWLRANYSHPMVAASVIIHLAADGTGYLDPTQCNVTVQLVDTKEQLHSLGEWRLSCRNNPLVIPVSHDLSTPFYRTQAILVTFRSKLVAISGVGLRSFQYFDPITISGCQSNEIYNPMGQSCVHYSCDTIDCQEPVVHNAEMKCSSPGYVNGVRCTITCNRGYDLQIHRDDDIIKTHDQWPPVALEDKLPGVYGSATYCPGAAAIATYCQHHLLQPVPLTVLELLPPPPESARDMLHQPQPATTYLRGLSPPMACLPHLTLPPPPDPAEDRPLLYKAASSPPTASHKQQPTHPAARE
ncbi:hypothetical protein DPEC_G00258960 [Dallia pectoralis]|uniref:Uncharacterized protein n=1 Tax=Dallia pectoralis TaxID=75939 RepID=A0ACC2FQX1_DALPE|nr:hypothetical protein DPEC_G00258960 [Dallia pectoralis]